MPKLVNRAKMTTATTGTGTITLGSAVSGYQTFAAAGVADTNVVRYAIEDGSNWEVGSGTYTSAGTTLSRTPSESSNAGSAINLSGTATVFVTAAASDLQELVTFAETFALPTSDGTNGQVLTTNGSGALTFTTVGGGGGSLTGQTDAETPFETSLGFEAGLNTTGINNTFVGYQAGKTNSTGTGNTSVGYWAAKSLTTGANNVAIGDGALGAATTGGRNIAIGKNAMASGVATTSSGGNIVVGYSSGTSITTGSTNVAIGYNCFTGNTTGGRNIAIGFTAMGFGVSTPSTGYNIAIGSQAGNAITTGLDNTLIGRATGASITIGVDNVSIGRQAGTTISSGSGNTIVGAGAGLVVSSGNNNTIIGNVSGASVATGNNNTVIGNGANATSTTVSDEITLGNSSITALRCQVTAITSLSDERDKTGIQPLNAGLDFVEALNPVSFTWNMRDGGKVGEADTGFIAQELQSTQATTGVTIPGLVYDVNPDKLEAAYGKLIPVLVQAVKELSAEVKVLKAQLEAR